MSIFVPIAGLPQTTAGPGHSADQRLRRTFKSRPQRVSRRRLVRWLALTASTLTDGPLKDSPVMELLALHRDIRELFAKMSTFDEKIRAAKRVHHSLTFSLRAVSSLLDPDFSARDAPRAYWPGHTRNSRRSTPDCTRRSVHVQKTRPVQRHLCTRQDRCPYRE